MEGTSSGAGTPCPSSFASRHQFLIYRLFSLAGLVPVGGYMVIHLLTNATILNGTAAFQTQVDRIHSLGRVLPLVEWTFIFLPLLFHAIVGWFIISGAVPNTNSYPYAGNIRYVLQRATGMIAFFFILFHVLQMHGMGKWLGGGLFDPEHAASSAAMAIDRALWIKVGIRDRHPGLRLSSGQRHLDRRDYLGTVDQRGRAAAGQLRRGGVRRGPGRCGSQCPDRHDRRGRRKRPSRWKTGWSVPRLTLTARRPICRAPRLKVEPRQAPPPVR